MIVKPVLPSPTIDQIDELRTAFFEKLEKVGAPCPGKLNSLIKKNWSEARAERERQTERKRGREIGWMSEWCTSCDSIATYRILISRCILQKSDTDTRKWPAQPTGRLGPIEISTDFGFISLRERVCSRNAGARAFNLHETCVAVMEFWCERFSLSLSLWTRAGDVRDETVYFASLFKVVRCVSVCLRSAHKTWIEQVKKSHKMKHVQRDYYLRFQSIRIRIGQRDSKVKGSCAIIKSNI